MNDAGTGFDRGESKSARDIGRAIIESLGRDDLAAVLFTFSGRSQNFTTDRAKLRAAVDSFTPRRSTSADLPLGCVLKSCVVETLRNVAQFFRTAPRGRKLLFLVGSSVGLELPADTFRQMTPLTEMFASLLAANVAVNTIDPSGLRTYAPLAEHRSRSDIATFLQLNKESVDQLRGLAETTGGRSVLNTNTPEASVPEIFAENGYYYLLGYTAPQSNSDARFHKISVRVRRPGVTIRSRSGYFRTPVWRDGSNDVASSPIDRAIESGFFLEDLPIQIHTAVFAGANQRDATVFITAGVKLPASQLSSRLSNSSAVRLDGVAAAFDIDWRERGRVEHSMKVPAAFHDPEHWYEVHSRMNLRPGRYEFRLALTSGERIGSVLANLDVPNFQKEELAGSTLVLGRMPQTPQLTADSEVLPIIPTVSREFTRTEAVVAFMRVYARGTTARDPVLLSAHVMDDAGKVVEQETREYAAGHFAGKQSVDFEFDLPLTRLKPGGYSLTVTVTAARRRLSRGLLFLVTPR
jgi:VWFA-related protein